MVAPIIVYSVAVLADTRLVTRYTWLASSAQEAEQELEEAISKPLNKQSFEFIYPQAKGATLTFEAVVAQENDYGCTN